jgi:hypothetical protein
MPTPLNLRLYAVELLSECLVLASSPEEAEDVARTTYLKDIAPSDWSIRATLSRQENPRGPLYRTLGWFDTTYVYAPNELHNKLTVLEAVDLDRAAVLVTALEVVLDTADRFGLA